MGPSLADVVPVKTDVSARRRGSKRRGVMRGEGEEREE
jgi:hypothetical protein